MWSIFRFELNNFFSSLIAYIVIGAFLILMGLMLFVFPRFSILEAGYASLESFFDLAPNILMFLIPAITMRSISEEIQMGTHELLLSKPISLSSIIVGKFMASLLMVIFALSLTLFYLYTVYQLGNPVGIIDLGATMASYLGLILLSAAFTVIGIFASSLSSNQIISFLIALVLCFFFYYGFEFISELPIFFGKTDLLVKKLGIEYHFFSLSRGVLDTRDVLYFFSIVLLFYFLSLNVLRNGKI